MENSIKILEELTRVNERIEVNKENKKACDIVLRMTCIVNNKKAQKSLQENLNIFKDNIEALEKHKKELIINK